MGPSRKPLNIIVLACLVGLRGGSLIGGPWCRETPDSQSAVHLIVAEIQYMEKHSDTLGLHSNCNHSRLTHLFTPVLRDHVIFGEIFMEMSQFTGIVMSTLTHVFLWRNFPQRGWINWWRRPFQIMILNTDLKCDIFKFFEGSTVIYFRLPYKICFYFFSEPHIISNALGFLYFFFIDRFELSTHYINL